jgi:hypothetical protein
MVVRSLVQAAPVTGWIAVNPQNGDVSTKPLSGAATDSPTLGNGANDTAAQVALYADITGDRDGAADVSLANGQKLTLTGSATLSGIVGSVEQFRWGLFNETAAPYDASGWRGFLASNSNGSGGGALRAKEPETGTFAQAGSAVTLASAQDGDEFSDGAYDFSMSISRYNDQVVIDAALATADGWFQAWNDVIPFPSSPLLFNYNRVGFLAGNGMHANQISFSDIDVTTAPIESLTLQVTTTGPYAGAVKIRNDQQSSYEIEYYEVVSQSGSLNFPSWSSLDDQEFDVELEGWEEAAGSDATLLSEYSLFATTSIPPSTSLALGPAFDSGAAQDLQFFVGLADGTLRRGIVDYVPGGLAGDFNADGLVDAADYVVWRKHAGTNHALPKDPHGGAIGSLQLALWRESFGTPPGSASVNRAATVPEPPALYLAALAGLISFAARRLQTISPSRGGRRYFCS